MKEIIRTEFTANEVPAIAQYVQLQQSRGVAVKTVEVAKAWNEIKHQYDAEWLTVSGTVIDKYGNLCKFNDGILLKAWMKKVRNSYLPPAESDFYGNNYIESNPW